jgi:outer membrane receptor protein involved in Fe transport
MNISGFKTRLAIFTVCMLMTLWSTPTLFGGTTGKISGRVISAETGEPLAGATVKVVGKSITAVTDLDGEFYVLNLPVASYQLAVQLIGYQTEIHENLQVLLDLTTPVEIQLKPVAIALDSAVTVVAERPLIQKDVTASVRTLTKQELETQPNARNIAQVLLRMNGTVSDNDGNLHVRGGRRGEVTYYFDGMPVEDQFSGAVGTRISPDALETVSLTTGGYSAAYGEALSGVVNALTQEGGSQYHGKVKLADGASKRYNVSTGDFGNMTRTEDYYGVFNLSGPIPLVPTDKASFFNSAEFNHNDGYLPHNRDKNMTITSKLSARPWQYLKMTFYSNIYKAEQQSYDHRDVNGLSYDFALANSGLIKRDAERYGGTATMQLSASTMFTVRAGYFETHTKLAPDNLFDLYWDQWPGYSVDENGLYNGTIQDNYYPDSTYHYVGYVADTSFYPYYLDRKSSYKTAGIDFLSQVGRHHQVSLGGEFRQNRLLWDNKQFFNVRPYGEKYDVGPSYAAGYLQDKIELGYLIINAGLRLDYLNAEVNYWHDPVTKDYQIRSKTKTHISPRIGFSHPVSENTLFHVNYGYYYQVPAYPHMFTNLQGDLTTGLPLYGNPDLEPERTISYELGVTQRLAEDMKLSATTYYKDVSNLVSTEFIDTPSGGYTHYINGDYGSIKGLDFSIVKTGTADSHLSGFLNYSYMIAKGNSSDANEFYYDYFTNNSADAPVLPVAEFPLSFDQRHTLNMSLSFMVPHGDKLNFAGLTLPSGWSANALFSYGSGMPYTRTGQDGVRIGEVNDARMPAIYRLDFRFDKELYRFSHTNYVRMFVDVVNLFDRRNVINVYSRTGLADYDGYNFNLTSDPPGPATAADVNALEALIMKDPQNYDPPRRIHWGLEWMF